MSTVLLVAAMLRLKFLCALRRGKLVLDFAAMLTSTVDDTVPIAPAVDVVAATSQTTKRALVASTPAVLVVAAMLVMIFQVVMAAYY